MKTIILNFKIHKASNSVGENLPDVEGLVFVHPLNGNQFLRTLEESML